MAHHHEKIKALFAQYHWALDYLKAELPAVSKVGSWPELAWFQQRQPLDLQPLTDQQLEIAAAAVSQIPRKPRKGKSPIP